MAAMVFPWKKSHSEKIFINYRRDDAGGFAGRLSDSLANYFGCDRVFRDVTDIDYGHDFEQAIDQKLRGNGLVRSRISRDFGFLIPKCLSETPPFKPASKFGGQAGG
jgi:hypothetical protein